MDFLIPTALAQTAGAAPQSQLLGIAPIILIFVVFYFLVIRPQSKKAKEHRDMVAKLAVGDEVVTNGGLLGRITDVGDSFVNLEIAKDVEVKVQRGQVAQLMPKGTVKNS